MLIQKSKQTVLDAFLQRGPLADWLKLCKYSLTPRTYEMNVEKLLLAGCLLVNQAAHVFVNDAFKTPANMFIALLGKPGCGKTTIMNLMRLVCDAANIYEIPTGSPEAMEEAIEEYRDGIIFWDEAGELVEKGSDYLQRVRYLLNKLYYLNGITRKKTTRKSVEIKPRSYYVSAVLGAIEDDWNRLISHWKGGFERRFLPLRLKKGRRMFEREAPRSEAVEAVKNLSGWFKPVRNSVFAVDFTDIMPVLKEVGGKLNVPEEYETAVEEYSLFVLSAILVSNVLAEAGRGEDFRRKIRSHGHYSPRGTINSFVTHSDYNDLYIVTYSDHVTKIFDGKLGEHMVTIPVVTLVTIVTRLVASCFTDVNVEIRESKVLEILDRIRSRVEKGVKIVSHKTFVREIIRIGNANIYRGYVKFLEDAGYIRVLHGKRGKKVILDLNAKICGNCALFGSSLCHNVSPGMPACKDFKPLEDG